MDQDWEGDEFVIRLKGTMREAEAMVENLTLTRRIETRLGSQRRFRIHDTVRNRGFAPRAADAPVSLQFRLPPPGPRRPRGRPDQGDRRRATRRRGRTGAWRSASRSPSRSRATQEKVFFHTLGTDGEGKTFIALLNRDIGGGQPLGIVMRWHQKELPHLVQWKMPRKGFYVAGPGARDGGAAGPRGAARSRARCR